MARGSQEREQEFIATAKETTGHTIEEWMSLIEQAQLEPKPNTILKHIKAQHGLNHLQANYLSGLYLNEGEPVFNYATLTEKLFDGHEQWRDLFTQLEAMVTGAFDDVVFVPTKAYFSIEGTKIFGCVKLTKKAIRYGLDLGTLPFEGRIQKAKSLGAMPNITHMIELQSVDDLDDSLQMLTQTAFNQVHG
ncbi:MAG: DUF5655 domain-containing protein [Phototrophicaceae bacterium]